MTRTRDEASARGPWTYRDLRERTPEDHVRREILHGWLYIDGQPVDDPMAEIAAESANVHHQGVVVELVAALARYREEHPGRPLVAPMDCAFGPHVLQPDVMWLDTIERIERPVDVVPVFVVEVSSPSTRRHDLVRKRRIYEVHGVGEFWFADLDALRIEQYVRAADGTYGPPQVVEQGTLTSVVLPGFAVDVDTILAPAAFPER